MNMEGDEDSAHPRRRGFAGQFATLVDPDRSSGERTSTPHVDFVFVLILTVAAGLRFYEIGRLSYWYDEVVSIRLARAEGIRALLRLLSEIDATRAPLHPLLLHYWTLLFGPSEAAGRSLSAVCGILTVALIHRIARRAFPGRGTALWAAWLAAISPMLLVYSREARMYSSLVLVTCLAWDALFALGSRTSSSVLAWYALAVAALVYSHPLGLLMAVALALVSFSSARADKRRLVALLGAAVLIAPWSRNYVDHAPEMLVGRLSIRFLIGTPIGFTGGNFLTLAMMLVVIALGMVSIRVRGSRGVSLETPRASVALLIWLIVPPALLWGYSQIAHPIFGPARYTLFVAPAYLILLARGIARLPRWLGGLTGLVVSCLAFWLLPTLVYAPDLKADWRAMAAQLDLRDPKAVEPVLVISNDPSRNLEIVTARYYLDARRPAVALPCPIEEVVALRRAQPPRLWVAIGTNNGWLTAALPTSVPLRRAAETLDVPGLRLIAIDPNDLP